MMTPRQLSHLLMDPLIEYHKEFLERGSGRQAAQVSRIRRRPGWSQHGGYYVLDGPLIAKRSSISQGNTINIWAHT